MHWTHGDVTDYDQHPPQSTTGQSPSSNLPTSPTALPNLGLPPLALPPFQGLPNLDLLNLRRPSSRQATQGPATTRSAPSSPFYPDRPESSAATTTSSGTPKKRRRAASWNEASIPHHHPSNPFSHPSHTYPSTPPLPDPDSDSEGSRAEFPGTPSASSPFKRSRTPFFPGAPPGRAPHQPPAAPTHPHPDPLALPSYKPPPLLHNLQTPLYMTRSAPNPSTASSSHSGNPRDSPPLWPSSPLHRSRDTPQWPSSPLQRSSHQHHRLPPRHHPRPHPSGPPYPTQPRHQHLHDDQHAYQRSSSPSQYLPQHMHPQPTPSHPQHDPASYSDHRRRPRHPPQQYPPHPDQYSPPTHRRHGSPQGTHDHHRQSPTHPHQQHQQQPYPYSSKPPAAHPSTRHNPSSRFSTSSRQPFDPTPAPHDPSAHAALYPRHARGPLSSTPAGSSSQHHFTHPDPRQTQLTHMDPIDHVDPFDQFDQELAWGVQQPASASSRPRDQPLGTHERPHLRPQPVDQQRFDQQHFDQQPVDQQPFDQDILDHLGLDQDFDAEQLFDQHLTSTFGQYPLEEAPSSQQHRHQEQPQQQQQQQQAHAVAVRSEHTGGPASWPGAGSAVSAAALLSQGAGSPVAHLPHHHHPSQPQQPQQYQAQPHPDLLPQPHAQPPQHHHQQPQSQPQPQPHALQPHLPQQQLQQQQQQQGCETAELATTPSIFDPHSSLPGTPEPPPFNDSMIDPAPTPDTPPPDPPPMPTPPPQYDPMHLDSGSCNPSPSAPPLAHPSPLSPAPLVTPTPTADAAHAWPGQASASSQPTPSQATASSTVHSLQQRSPHPRAARPPLSQPEAWPVREGSTSLPSLPSQHSRDLSITDMYNELVSIHALPNLPPLPDRPRPPSPGSFPQSYAAPMRGPSPNYDSSWPDMVSFRDRSPSRPQALPGPHSWGQPGGSGSFRHKMHYGTGLQLAESASQAASQGPRLPSPPSKWPIPISSGTHPQMWHQPPSVPVYDPQYWPRDNQSSDSS